MSGKKGIVQDMTYGLGQLKDPPLAGEEDSSSKDTLDDFAADALVESLNTFLPDDGKETVQRRFVLESVGGTGLKSALHNANLLVSRRRVKRKRDIHIGVGDAGSN